MKIFWILSLGFLIGCAGKKEAPEAAKGATETKTETTTKVEASGKKTVKSRTKSKTETETAPTEAKDAAGASGATVTCKAAGDERLIEVVSTEGGGCEVKYTKGGAASIVATANSGTDHCQTVADKIKGNLTGAGYACE